MPTDGFEPVVRMAAAFGLVAAVAGPVGLVAWRVGRRAVPGRLPVPLADDPVFALLTLGLFLGHQILVAVLGQVAVPRQPGQDLTTEDAVWRTIVGTLLASPAVLAWWLWFRGSWSWRSASRAVAVGVAGWLVVSPGVYAILSGAEWASSLAGVMSQEHPLVQVVTGADTGRVALLFAAVAIATPFAEEVIFRGLMLGWLVRRPHWAAMPVGVAALLTVGTTNGTVRLLAGSLLVVLTVGLVLVRHRPEVAAVWATATLFAAVHASVWPTPVPLFLLGLALGWVAVRTGGVLAGTVLHGLFNAVSLVYLLRG